MTYTVKRNININTSQIIIFGGKKEMDLESTSWKLLIKRGKKNPDQKPYFQIVIMIYK